MEKTLIDKLETLIGMNSFIGKQEQALIIREASDKIKSLEFELKKALAQKKQ